MRGLLRGLDAGKLGLSHLIRPIFCSDEGIKTLLQPALPGLKFLYSAMIELERSATAIGTRAIFNVLGGTFEGPALRGTILRSGGDWLTVRPDGTKALDVRMTLQTDDGHLIFSHYSGRIVLPPDIEKMGAAERAEVDPSLYYFRTAPLYETISEKYDWVNGIQAIGVGRMRATGVAYDTFMVM